MALTVGTRVGPYEITGTLGAGGMGEVYRARDAKLNREVAIKIVPAALASDAAALARFQTEAQAVAALSHPNILAIFDFGVDAGVPYAVMELLDGRTLRELLEEGPLSPRKAIDLGAQIAAGLAAAHGRGITHRDLKPENIFVTRDGRVKILDFGLAKVDAPAGLAAGSLVATVSPTSPGTVLGTVGYMSPEQARGQTADPRSDIFSLGTMLYEVLSGRRAFSGPSAIETMNAILKEDPPELTRTNAAMPPALDRIVQRALEKNPDERFQSARDFGFALEAISGSGMSTPAPASGGAAATLSRRWLRPVIAVVALAVAAAAGAVAARVATGEPAFTPVTFETKTFDPQTIFNARFMPDGATIVFSAALQGNSPELFVSRAGAVAPQPLGVPGTHLLSISSRGELAVLTNVAFLGQRLFSGTLGRMPIDGTPRPWLENVREADWSPDGSTIAIIRDMGGTDRLEYPAGTMLYEASGYLSDVRVSPDGNRVAFMEHPARFDDRGFVKIVDRGGTVRTLAGEYWGEEGIVWTRDNGTVLYAGADNGGETYQIHAVNADGTPAPRLVLPSPGAMFILDVAADGQWLVTRTDDNLTIKALVAGRSGERDFPWLGSALGPVLSRDGRLLLFTDQSASAGTNYAVTIRGVDGSPPVRLGDGSAQDISRDGTRVLAQLFNPEAAIVYPTGPGDPKRLSPGTLERVAARQFFPDGKRVVVCGNEPGKPFRCYEQDLVGGVPRPLTPEGFDAGPIKGDGSALLLHGLDRTFSMLSLDDGTVHPVAGMAPDDVPVDWTADGTSVIVEKSGVVPARLERVNVTTGMRTLVRQVEVDDLAGVMYQRSFSVLDDGRSYAYTLWRQVSRLFVVRGARTD